MNLFRIFVTKIFTKSCKQKMKLNEWVKDETKVAVSLQVRIWDRGTGHRDVCVCQMMSVTQP